MLYKELGRVNEIDTAISDLHHHLADLYQERASILNAKTSKYTSAKEPVVLSKPTKMNVQSSYNTLQASWSKYGGEFPAYKAIESKLTKACALVTQLEAANPSLKGSVSVVAVPPSSLLSTILTAISTVPGNRFKFIGIEDVKNAQKTKNWALTVVIDPKFSLPVYGLQAFLDRKEFMYNGYDCRGLGLSELVAAELQGVNVINKSGWTVLLKDSNDTENVVSATLDTDQIMIKAEDADCLLGENYLRLAITVG